MSNKRYPGRFNAIEWVTRLTTRLCVLEIPGSHISHAWKMARDEKLICRYPEPERVMAVYVE